MHILGLSNGSINGNSETLLKASLQAAKRVDPAITTSFIHVPSVSIPHNAPPINTGANLTSALYDREWGRQGKMPDDRMAVLNAVLDADAIIFASPVYSHQPAGSLKAMTDSIFGPFTDAAFARRIARGHDEQDPKYVNMPLDRRLLKPKIAAFLIVCGSAPGSPDQWTMALPTMHLITYPLHAKVVDQYVAPGCNYPGAVLLRDEVYIKRAEQLGENVASQLGRPFDEALYLGEEEDGACPYCHLLKYEFRDTALSNDVRCITCGAQGTLKIRDNGQIRPVWEKDSEVSSITLAGKAMHLEDILNGVKTTKLLMMAEEIQTRREYWKGLELNHVVLPSTAREESGS